MSKVMQLKKALADRQRLHKLEQELSTDLRDRIRQKDRVVAIYQNALGHHRAFLQLLLLTSAPWPVRQAAIEQLKLSDFMNGTTALRSES